MPIPSSDSAHADPGETGAGSHSRQGELSGVPAGRRRLGVRQIAILGALGLAAIASGVYLLRPRLHGAQHISWRIVCQQQLKSVGMSLHQYAYEQKALPEDAFRVLLDSGDLSAKQLICPCSVKTVEDIRADPYACYVLVPGMPTARAAGVLDGSLVLAYGLDNHGGEGASVLYADGHCTFVHPYSRVIEEVESTQRWLAEEWEDSSAP